MNTEELLKVVIDALEDIKAVDIRVLDVRDRTSITDVMVIASGKTDRQTRSLAANVVEKAKAVGVRPLGTEGERTGDWVLVDLGDVVVHVMLPEIREFYDLERLWSGDDVAKPVAKLR